MAIADKNLLGNYLKDCRARLDPATFGFSPARRRTPGLRREEIAQRASVSATWYTWLEQGRGGAPSADVLERLAHALVLSDVEREHLFLLAQGRPPEIRYRPNDGVTPQLQRVLDALELSPALIRTATWDVLAWNRVAEKVLGDYASVPPAQRNILRRIFLDPRARKANLDWESVARGVVAVFRADVVRSGACGSPRATALIAELREASPEFAAMWRDNKDVRSFGEGVKRLIHPQAGRIAFEYSAFAVDGRTDLGMIVYNPATAADIDKVKALLAAA